MSDAIRASLDALGWSGRAADVPVLYGGSVTSANIDAFMAEPSIDGALVGGASLKPDEMAGIVARAGITARAAAGRRPARDRIERRPRPIVLVVLDGFGIGTRPGATPSRPRRCRPGAASCAAGPTPVLRASEDAVGLPPARWATPRWGT